VLGTLDDSEILARAARAADIVVNAASADHKGAVVALLDALGGTGKPFIHTSGSSIVGTRAKGERSDAIFDEDTPITPSPARAARVALNEFILSYRDKGCRPVIICPSLIYGAGLGANPDSVQVPLLIRLAKKRGNAAHAGPGENIWSNVHIDDLVTLYALAIDKAPAGSFYFAENGENSMREACEAINRMLGFAGPPAAMSMSEAAAEWSEGTTEDTMASNSRAQLDRRDRAGVLPGVGRRTIASAWRAARVHLAICLELIYNAAMTKVLEDAIEKVRKLPEDRQAYVAEVLEQIAAAGSDPFVVPEGHRMAVLEGLREAEQGEFVSDEEMAALWKKCGL
jgi:nucleoside-diphosphate-sugar epimerase/predicted transcriptional regulator